MQEVTSMPFLAAILLILAGGRTSTAALNHIRLAEVSGSDPVASKTLGDQQSSDQENKSQTQPKHSQKHARKDLQTETLTGTVEWEYKPLAWDCDVPNCDHYALYDDTRHANYELDDSRAALPFEDQRVRVTGVVHRKDSVIHVLSIEAAK
jgi:hypothetical protein